MAKKKKKNRTILRKKRFYIVLALIVFLSYALGDLMQLRMSNEEFEALQMPMGYEVKATEYKVGNRNMRYVEVGDNSKPMLMFIHGAPSSSAFWRSFLKDSLLLSSAKLVAVDRPGYGYSGFGNPETSVKKQADLIAPILREKRKIHDQIILLGSSYGGTVVARLAMDYPDLVDGIIFQSSSLAPGEETIYWLSYPFSQWPLSVTIPKTLRMANTEKFSHEEELKKMADRWDRIKCAFTILHGDKDGLIYPSNARYALEKLVNGDLVDFHMVPNSGHDLTWTQPKLIKSSILNMLDHITNSRLASKE